jgi:acyl carrier protein
MAVRAIDYFSEVYGVKREQTKAVSPSEGVDIFLRIIGSQHPRVAVWPQDLGIAIEHEKSFLDIAHSLESAKPSHSRPDLPIPYTAPGNEQEQEIAEIWQELLGIQRIGIYDNYFELGGDSLLAVQFISRLRDNLEMELPLARLFEKPTIAGLTELIETIRLTKQGLRSYRETVTRDREEGEI